MDNERSFLVAMLVVCLLTFPAARTFAQNAVVADPAHYSVELENESVRVLRVRYGAGERSVMHSHPSGVLVFLTDGEGTFTTPDGKKQVLRWKAGQSEWVSAMTHLPHNTGDKPYELLFVELKSGATPQAGAGAARAPIIDMHLHASAADDNGPPPLALCLPLQPHMPPLDPRRSWADVFLEVLKNPECSDPIWSPVTEDALMEETIAVLRRRNIVGVLSGPPERVLRWYKAAPDRFIPSVQFRIGRDAISPGEMRNLFEQGPFVVLGEISNQYSGILPDDERMRPYWALAEELDVPVAIHVGEGPPGVAHLERPYRSRISNPYLLEEVLARHPRLRVSVMHYGSPMIDEMIAMLHAYPHLYVDLGGIQWMYPRPYFYRQLRQFIDAGFGKRVMFGSDQMNWPGVIEPALAIIEEAPFLSEEQKRDILYDNAARFLRLSDEQIARHHARALTGTWEYRQANPASETGYDAEGERLEIVFRENSIRAIYHGVEREGEHGLYYSVSEVEELSVRKDGRISFKIPARHLYHARPATLAEAKREEANSSGFTKYPLEMSGHIEDGRLTLHCVTRLGNCPEDRLVFRRAPS